MMKRARTAGKGVLIGGALVLTIAMVVHKSDEQRKAGAETQRISEQVLNLRTPANRPDAKETKALLTQAAASAIDQFPGRWNVATVVQSKSGDAKRFESVLRVDESLVAIETAETVSEAHPLMPDRIRVLQQSGSLGLRGRITQDGPTVEWVHVPRGIAQPSFERRFHVKRVSADVIELVDLFVGDGDIKRIDMRLTRLD